MSDVLLELREITKQFGGFTALSGVNVKVARGERIGLIGPNGSGKTTLMNCISGALLVSSGRVLLEGRDISAMPAHGRTRQGIARSFQIPRPFHSMTVSENLMIPLEYVANRRPERSGSMYDEAMNLLEAMGLSQKADALPNQLTQVELRKMELARAMAANPQLLICDESMAGLSHSEVDEVLTILLQLNEQKGITIIMIEHIMAAVMRFSQRVLCLDAGKLVCEGTPAEVVSDPLVQRAYLGT